MKISNRTWITLLITAIMIGLFLIYRYGFSERFFNLSTQTAVIDLHYDSKAILIEKHTEQGDVTQLELEITGKLSDNITIYLSENGIHASTSIRIKKGDLQSSFATNWNRDKAYILLDNPGKSTSTINVDYRFIAKKK